MADEFDRGKRTVAASEKSFAIVEDVSKQDGATVTGIADRLDYAKSTVHQHVRTLEGIGYLVETAAGYRLGLNFLNLGNVARNRWGLYDVSKRELDELVSSIGEHGYVMVEEQGRGVYIYQSKSERAVQTDSQIGTTVSLHTTAIGKAYLAHLPPEERDALLETMELTKRTSSTITDKDRLREELAEVSERNVAFNDQERFEGLRAVGAPVLGPDDEVMGAISVAGPTTRMKGERFSTEIPERVSETARIIGIRATFS